jgi:hypothetical protein
MPLERVAKSKGEPLVRPNLDGNDDQEITATLIGIAKAQGIELVRRPSREETNRMLAEIGERLKIDLRQEQGK